MGPDVEGRIEGEGVSKEEGEAMWRGKNKGRTRADGEKTESEGETGRDRCRGSIRDRCSGIDRYRGRNRRIGRARDRCRWIQRQVQRESHRQVQRVSQRQV